MDDLHFLSWFLYFNILADNCLWTQVKCQAYNQSQTYLADNFEFPVQTFFVFLKDFDVIIGKAQRS